MVSFCNISDSQVCLCVILLCSSNRKVALANSMNIRTCRFDVLLNDGGKFTIALYYFQNVNDYDDAVIA